MASERTEKDFRRVAPDIVKNDIKTLEAFLTWPRQVAAYETSYRTPKRAVRAARIKRASLRR